MNENIVSFFGEQGRRIAHVIRVPGSLYRVEGYVRNSLSISKQFLNEQDAEDFAEDFAFGIDSSNMLLNEDA